MQTNSTIKSRLAEFLKHIGMGQAKFADNVGLSKGFANNVGDSIRADNLAKISAIYPELNTVWLLTGAGQMLNAPKNPYSQKSVEEMKATEERGFLAVLMEAYERGEIYSAEAHNKAMAEKDIKIERLQREVWELQKKLEDISK